MRFSILIPVYNTEKYLDACLRSVLQQDYDDWEVILTDDGSTDDSRSICEHYAQADHRIRFYSKENKGLLATRREQLALANGEYVLFLDSDDYWEPGILSTLSTQIDRSSPDLICYGYHLIDDTGNTIQRNIFTYPEDQEFSTCNIGGFIKDFFADCRLCYLWTKCVRKSIIDVENTYDEFSDVYGEDLLQSCEIVCRAKKVFYLCCAFVNYRRSNNAKSNNLSPSFVIDTMCVRDYLYTRIAAHHLEKAVADAFLERCFKDILHRYQCLFEMCRDYKEFSRYYKAMQEYPVFGCAVDYMLNKPAGVSKGTRLMIQKPFVYYSLRKTKAKIRPLVHRLKALKKNSEYLLSGWYQFECNRFKQKQLTASVYKQEYKKYKHCLQKDARKDIVFAQMKAFLTSSISLVSDNLEASDDSSSPIVFVVERNELQRMRIFFEHYRKLGVKQFVVLDNGSDDGTLAFLAGQAGTRVYQTLEAFQTQKKEAWIEKLLVLNGLNRWCIVVDADELLDYTGSEDHPITELITRANHLGHKRIWGYMLDMYADKAIFSQEESAEPFIACYRYFDVDSYLLNRSDDPNTTRLYDEIYGGPRLRMFGRGMALSKQAIFFYEKDLLYRSCHFMYPLMKWGEVPCWFVLRHYKFLPGDRKEYERRIREKCFYNNSIEYKVIMEQVDQNTISMFYEGSVEYRDSNSLRCLPYIEEIEW